MYADVRFAPPFEDLLKAPDHAHRRQREVHVNAQGCAVVVVDHVERAERAPVLEAVAHEVHRLHLVRARRHGQRLGLLPADALVVSLESLLVPEIIIAEPEAPPLVVFCQAGEPRRYGLVFRLVSGRALYLWLCLFLGGLQSP